MNRKIAAVLLAASMLTTPALAASVASSPDMPTAQTVNPHKVAKTSDKGVKKHRVHARASHGQKAHHAKHAKPNQVKHARKNSKKNLTSAGTKSQARAVEPAPTKAPVKN
jgi:negative regulator of sigma E activity